jgi:glycosyltransferase involved in cell wall biosynthesis
MSPHLQSLNAADYPRSLAPAQSSATLKVAIVSDAIAGRNGVGTYYQDLAEHLRGSVASLQLICPATERDSSLESFSLPIPGDNTQRLSWPRVRELNRRLDGQAPNILVLPTLGAFTFFAWRYAIRHRIPIAAVCHTDFDQLVELYWPGPISRPLRSGLIRMNRWLLSQANAVATMNSNGLQASRNGRTDLVRVMGTPLAPDFLRRPISRETSNISRAIFAGRLAPEKGIDRWLDAVQKCPDLSFTMVGDGPLRKQVQEVAKRHANLRVLGWQTRARVLQEMDAADVLVLPSDVETFGTVALEALARHRCVLVSTQCGIARWSSLSGGLFFIEQGETLAMALRRLQQMPATERAQIVHYGSQAAARFNVYTVQKWLKFLSDAAAA